MKRQNVDVKIIQPIEKAESSVQLNKEETIYANDWPSPELDMDGLDGMVNNSSILPQCIKAYSSNIAGYGIGIKYKDPDQEETSETLAEWAMLEDLLDLFTIEQDTKELFEDVVTAREKFGISYLEVIRTRKGEVTQLSFIKETADMRKSVPLLPAVDEVYYYKGREVKRKKKFRKYKQEIGGKTVYFKEFGDPRSMDCRDGNYSESVPFEYQANEILDFSIGTDTYGTVRWIGQILGCDGTHRAEALNNNYFINGRHTPLAIVVKGGTLSEKSIRNLQTYINGIRGENGQHKFLLLETENIESDFDAKAPEVELKDLASILQKDELFQEYMDNNRRRVQSSFNLPDLYVGYTTDFNRATAQTAMEVTEKQVFQPERKSLAWKINNRLLNGYQLKYCEVFFNAPDITNPDDLFKLLTVANNAGGLTPNQAKQVAASAMGEESADFDGEWGDIPVCVQNLQKESTIQQIGAQIEKAEKAGDQEIVSVMREVQKLLKAMKEE